MDAGMDILYLLVPLSLLLVFCIAGVFWWSLRSGQFEDLDGPGYRVIMDDDKTVEAAPAAAEPATLADPTVPSDIP